MKNLNDIARMENICLELQIKTYNGDLFTDWEYWSYLQGWRDCLKWITEKPSSTGEKKQKNTRKHELQLLCVSKLSENETKNVLEENHPSFLPILFWNTRLIVEQLT